MGNSSPQSLKKNIEELKERERFNRKLRDHNDILLRVMVYLNVMAALFQFGQKHYILAATNVLTLVVCLEFVLRNYRKREKNCRQTADEIMASYEKITNLAKEMDEKIAKHQDSFKQDIIEMEELLSDTESNKKYTC